MPPPSKRTKWGRSNNSLFGSVPDSLVSPTHPPPNPVLGSLGGTPRPSTCSEQWGGGVWGPCGSRGGPPQGPPFSVQRLKKPNQPPPTAREGSPAAPTPLQSHIYIYIYIKSQQMYKNKRNSLGVGEAQGPPRPVPGKAGCPRRRGATYESGYGTAAPSCCPTAWGGGGGGARIHRRGGLVGERGRKRSASPGCDSLRAPHESRTPQHKAAPFSPSHPATAPPAPWPPRTCPHVKRQPVELRLARNCWSCQ